MADKHPGYMTTFKERLSYWTYFIGQNIYYNITAAFISTYLAMQGVNLAKVAIVLLIVKIWDAVNDPIFGFIFDKVKFKNGQKSLPWLRISTALIPIVTIILFSIPSALGETGKLVWFGVAYVLWDTVYTLTDIPAYAMLNTMTDNLPERNTLLSVNRVFSGAGVLIYGVVLPILISENVGMSASLAIATLSIFSALTMVPLSLNCKERNYKPEEEDENFSPRQMFSYLGKNKYLLRRLLRHRRAENLRRRDAVRLLLPVRQFPLLHRAEPAEHGTGCFRRHAHAHHSEKAGQIQDAFLVQHRQHHLRVGDFLCRLRKPGAVPDADLRPHRSHEHRGHSRLHVHPGLC